MQQLLHNLRNLVWILSKFKHIKDWIRIDLQQFYLKISNRCMDLLRTFSDGLFKMNLILRLKYLIWMIQAY